MVTQPQSEGVVSKFKGVAVAVAAVGIVAFMPSAASAAPAAEQCTAWEAVPNSSVDGDSKINDGTMTIGIEKQVCNTDGRYQTYIRANAHQNAEQTRPEEVDHMRVRMHQFDRRTECPTCAENLIFEIEMDQPGVGRSYLSPRYAASVFKVYQADVTLFYVDKPYYYSQYGSTRATVPLVAMPAPRQGAEG